MEVKYVVGAVPNKMGLKTTEAIVFSALSTHSQIARMLKMDVKSAGFVNFIPRDGVLGIQCHGHSTSLSVESDPEDASYIALTLGLDKSKWEQL